MSAGPDNGQVLITNKDIYFELQKVSRAVDQMGGQAAQLQDHETRIRGVERWKYSIPPALILGGVSLYLELRHG